MIKRNARRLPVFGIQRQAQSKRFFRANNRLFAGDKWRQLCTRPGRFSSRFGCSGTDRYTQVMPIFEYVCQQCRHQFELIVNGNNKVACPSCQSRRLEKQLSVFAVNTKASVTTNVVRGNLPMAPCGSCGDPRGPGSCSLN